MPWSTDNGAFSSKEGMRMSENNSNHFTFPIWLKTTLTITEAAEYSNIGINKIEGVGNEPNCDFVLYVGRKRLIKRNRFEQFIDRHLEK